MCYFRVRSFTGMDIITGMDYRNGHYAMALGAFNVFYLHKMYFCSHMNSLHQKDSSQYSKIDFPGWLG